MFIGGLHLSTEVETLKDYFTKWGSIIDAVVMTDGATKRSRGFGFVTYSSSQAVDDCLAAKPHVIDGKDVRKYRSHVTFNQSDLFLEIECVIGYWLYISHVWLLKLFFIVHRLFIVFFVQLLSFLLLLPPLSSHLSLSLSSPG